MRKKQELILVDGVDRTDSVQSVSLDDGRYRIVYQNSEKEYTYRPEKVQILKECGRIDPERNLVIAGGQILGGVESITDYGTVFSIETDRGRRVYPRAEIALVENVLSKKRPAQRLEYFRALASAVSLRSEEGFNILEHQYGKIRQVRGGTALGAYLDPQSKTEPIQPPELLLYPFGMNRSQKKAVENAFSAPVSIIQGPPGTGKTQTILNILANAVMNGKTAAVVSGNHAATKNVEEKLAGQKLDFLTGLLGSRAHKEAFLSAQTGKYPSMRGWKLDDAQAEELRGRLRQQSEELNRRLGDQNRIAAIRQELLELEPESRHFAAYYAACPHIPGAAAKLFLPSDKVLKLLAEYESAAREQMNPSLLQKLFMLFRYHMPALRLMRQPPEAVVPYLQSEFYRIRKEELEQEIKLLESKLQNYAFEERMKELTEDSMKLFRDCLVRRYRYSKPRRIFEPGELTMKSAEFLGEYPIVLSTTYSIKSCLGQDVLYDYLIVDEASQVDLATGVLALSCAKNVVIVGDQKQLPNVLTAENVRLAEPFWDPKLGNGYCFTKHSLLSSAAAVWKEAPAVLLREHYRCHPKIINFCNQEFYDGQLIALTEDHGEENVLSLCRTPEGNHARGRINQREANVIQNEVLPRLRRQGFQDIGVIAPYRDQVELLQKQLTGKMEIDTVHKFQGREKDAVILSSVDNMIGPFVNDGHLLNVAVSRAVRSLTVVTSSNPANDETLYGDLARYIRYHNLEIRNSTTYSVFDLLYKEYAARRREYLRRRRRISEYDSENLLFSVIEQILAQPEFSRLDCAVHVPLGAVIRDRALLSAEERTYLQNPLTHVDFLIFHRIDKAPVLAIEVDGVSFHGKGTAQEKRDRKKDRICETVGLPLLRLRTDSSGERGKIEAALRAARMKREEDQNGTALSEK